MRVWTRYRRQRGVAAAILALALPSQAAAEYAGIWGEAFEWCRLQMESAEPRPVPEGYVVAPEADRLALARDPVTVTQGGRTVTIPGLPAPDALLYPPGGRLSVIVTPVQCGVLEMPGRKAAASERQTLIARYKSDRDALIAAGTHRIVLRQGVRPIQELLHEPLRRNGLGECTLSRVAWNMQFITGVTQTVPDADCALPPAGGET